MTSDTRMLLNEWKRFVRAEALWQRSEPIKVWKRGRWMVVVGPDDDGQSIGVQVVDGETDAYTYLDICPTFEEAERVAVEWMTHPHASAFSGILIREED